MSVYNWALLCHHNPNLDPRISWIVNYGPKNIKIKEFFCISKKEKKPYNNNSMIISNFEKSFSLKSIYKEKMGYLLNINRAKTYISKPVDCRHLKGTIKPNKKTMFFKKDACQFKKLIDLQNELNHVTQNILENITSLNLSQKEEVFKDFILPTELMIVFKK